VGGSVPNVITDLILVVFPLPYVWSLHAPITQRIVLGGMFALGIFVSIVSMIRLSILLDTAGGTLDLTYTFKDVYLWSLVEINVGLICTCLPSLRPILRVLGLNRFFSIGDFTPSDQRTPDPSQELSGNALNSRKRAKGTFSQIEDHGTKIEWVDCRIISGELRSCIQWVP
jgi:hypothetical protein